MRSIAILLSILIVATVSYARMPVTMIAGPGPAGSGPGGGGGGQAYVDTFTRSSGNTNLNTNCTGPDTPCEWEEHCSGTADACLATTATILNQTASVTWRAVNGVSGADADTLSQYVAARQGGTTAASSGITLRDEGLTGSGTGSFYTLRYNSSVPEYVIRSCDDIAFCITIATISTANLGGTMSGDDSIGFATDGATGDSVKFSLWYWDAANPPARGSWGAAAWTVCSSGCSQAFGTAPSATGPGVADTGYRGGIYDGSAAGGTTWDYWMFGDNP